MSENFLNKYSPKNINEYHIDNYDVFNNNMNLLISGASGSGKTSLLLTFIKQHLNCENIYTNENLLFMNNLKDQGIQYCRSNVKTFCQTQSRDNCRKIIAIDDIDEFSDISQQVICNCLTKYSNNILCLATCNNTLKVFNGLKSRMVFVTVYLPTQPMLKIFCEKVIAEEKIVITHEHIIDMLINSCNFHYKVLLNSLQKIKLYNSEINLENINELIASINLNIFIEYIKHLQNNDLNKAIHVIFKIVNSGVSAIDILFDFFYYTRDNSNAVIADSDKYKIIQIISKYITIFNNCHEDSIELAFMTNEIYAIFHNI